jgi:Uncharacterized lipoprotein
MRHHFLAFALFGSLLVNGSVFARGEPLANIPLKWSPTSTLSEWGAVDLSGATITTKIQFDALTDTRQNPSLVAENREKADKVRQVTTSSDVAVFVGEHLKEALHGAGLNIVDSGADVIISSELRKFFVTETGTYNGEISLLIHVKTTTGKELWTGIVSGDASRWGRSYSAANYYETMSNMVLSATYNLLNNSGFRDSLAQH